MYTIKTTIEGIAPILFNAPSLDMLNPVAGQRLKTDADRDAEALKRAYVNERGLYLPAWNIKKALLQGFQSLDLRVPGSKTKRLWRFVQPVLFIEPDQVLFGVENPDFLHKCPGRNADGSATIVRRPAMRDGWHLSFSIRILDDVVREDDLRLSLQTTGERVALGGWRPEYGRFVIRAWERLPLPIPHP